VELDPWTVNPTRRHAELDRRVETSLRTCSGPRSTSRRRGRILAVTARAARRERMSGRKGDAMRLAPRQFTAVALAAFCALALAYERACAADPELTPLAVEALAPFTPVMGSDGQRHLVYELRIENMSGGGFNLKTIDVVDPKRIWFCWSSIAPRLGSVLPSAVRAGLNPPISVRISSACCSSMSPFLAASRRRSC
jgi:hypothetical protein